MLLRKAVPAILVLLMCARPAMVHAQSGAVVNGAVGAAVVDHATNLELSGGIGYRFNRAIGQFAGQKFHAKTGEMLSDKDYEQHFVEAMPTAEDRKRLLEIIANEKKWIAEKEGARDPFETIGEPRKSAINL